MNPEESNPFVIPKSDEPAASSRPVRFRSRLAKTITSFLYSISFHLLFFAILASVYLPGIYDSTKQLILQPGLRDQPGEPDVFGDGGEGGNNGESLVQVEESVGEKHPESDVEEISFAQAPSNDTKPQEQSESWGNLSWNADEPSNNTLALDSFLSATGGGKGGTSFQSNALAGRGGMKGLLVSRNGGSEGSERAVALGLNWLAVHQNPNGSWAYDFTNCPSCRGKCGNPGNNPSINSATAFALLPFLGTGITHKQGKKEYREVVDKGLRFLLAHSKMEPQGLNFIDVQESGLYGGMYHQGIVSILICEAAAMSDDPILKKAAQRSIDYICFAQIPADGGWRYWPQDKTGGDTSVLGWQIMALKSGQMGGLVVPNESFRRAKYFLDSIVATDGGAKYGYMSNRNDQDGIKRDIRGTTSIGLLCQMYMGWQVDNPALVRGVKYLSEKGPDRGNLYYDYYATQVMHHYGGEEWDKWNRKMRDPLIALQATTGHERGSWCHEGKWNDDGGRLYTTCVALLTLEVYYRHLPLYKKRSTQEQFPLE